MGRNRMAIRGKKIDFLSRGSLVEVSSTEEGFEGAWFVAKILKSSYKRKRKLLIQYQTLLSDRDPDQLLTEKVDNSFTRPLPPPPAADQSYEVHDVVDAFHRDGWWKGVVSEVQSFEGERGISPKYSVVFETPPEKFDFFSENLRFNYVWTSDGKWVRSPKQKRMAGLNIDKGMAVEVNFGKEKLEDAWFPAIVVDEVGFNSFLVEYSRSGNDGQMKETVDSFHIRPPPPKLEVQNFEILECVEAFHDSCWKKGTIVETFTHGRYNVLVNYENEIQFSQSEMRPHLMWQNGKWIGFREVPNTTRCEKQSTDVQVSFTSSSAVKFHNEEKSSSKRTSDKMSPSKDDKFSVKKSRKDMEKESNAFGHKDKGEQKNVSEGAARKIEVEDCVSKGTSIENTGAEARGESSNQHPVITVEADNELVKNHVMPFTKSSPIWEYVDSLDVFKAMPQNPHFSPLFERHEAIREGFAIGQMLTFSSLVENASKLQKDVPIKDLETSLEALADLELHGFDVKKVVDRITKLLAIRTRQERLKNESKEIHRKIEICNGEVAEMEEEIYAIDKILRVLEIVREVKLSEKARIAAKIDNLELDADKINEAILNVKRDYESRAAAAW